MDNASNEKLRVSRAASKLSGAEKTSPEESSEVNKQAREVVGDVGVEGVESREGAEAIDGKISESSGEDKKRASATGGGASYSADEIEAIRAKLLAALPPQDVMIKEIRKKLIKEEKVITKRIKKIRRRAHRKAFQLTIMVAQLRRVREYFSMLAHATYEMVKHLWLKIVHGV